MKHLTYLVSILFFVMIFCNSASAQRGYYEQEYHPSSNEVELINLGVLKEFRGLKLGSTLVNHAIASASRKNPVRMWVHTCSLDHKHALQNYKSKGFEIFKEEEIDFVA